MGVSISSQRDSVNGSVDKGGEHLNQSEGDRNPIIREKESIDSAGLSEVFNPLSEPSSSFGGGFDQIKEKRSSLQSSTSQLDSREENRNCDDTSGDLIKDCNVLEEPQCERRAPGVESANIQNSRASLMQNVFSMLGISKKTQIPEGNESLHTELDEAVPEDQNLPHMNPVSESLEDINDENTTRVSGDPLLDDDYLKRSSLEQSLHEEQKNLVRTTGEFPR